MNPTKESRMKAYKVWLDHGDGSTVVFAKSRNEAKMIALGCDCCEGAQYIDVSAKRMKALDSLYKGESEIDWYDPETRLLLVRDYGWCCLDPSWECDKCIAKKYCMYGEEDDNAQDA